MPENEEPYGAGFRLAWCPICVDIDGQAMVVAVPPGTKFVRCKEHGSSELAPPLGDKTPCTYPVGRTTCGYTRAEHIPGEGGLTGFHDFTTETEK